MWDLIVSVPDHCLSFYFETTFNGFINLNIILLHWTENSYSLQFYNSISGIINKNLPVRKIVHPDCVYHKIFNKCPSPIFLHKNEHISDDFLIKQMSLLNTHCSNYFSPFITLFVITRFW